MSMNAVAKHKYNGLEKVNDSLLGLSADTEVSTHKSTKKLQLDGSRRLGMV